jgi:hypothetical protein
LGVVISVLWVIRMRFIAMIAHAAAACLLGHD